MKGKNVLSHDELIWIFFMTPFRFRWNAPISIALHAPGTDFLPTLNSIKYLRDCLPESNLVKQFVTFHIYFSSKHVPKAVSHKFIVIEPFAMSINIHFATLRFQSTKRCFLHPSIAVSTHHSSTRAHRNCTRHKRNYFIQLTWAEILHAMLQWHILY